MPNFMLFCSFRYQLQNSRRQFNLTNLHILTRCSVYLSSIDMYLFVCIILLFYLFFHNLISSFKFFEVLFEHMYFVIICYLLIFIDYVFYFVLFLLLQLLNIPFLINFVGFFKHPMGFLILEATCLTLLFLFELILNFS